MEDTLTYDERRKRINKILLNMGKYDAKSIQYEILRRELVRQLDELDEIIDNPGC